MVRFSFAGDISDGDIIGLADLTNLLIAEYDLQIAVTVDTEAKEIRLAFDGSVEHEAQASEYTIKDVLNTKVNKDEEDLSPRQIKILKTAYNYREYYRLLEKRYHVVIPNLVGMSEEQAIALLQQLGIVPGVVREKVKGYDPTQDGGFAPADESAGMPDTSGTGTDEYPEGVDSICEDWPAEPADQLTWDFPVVDFGCVFYQDGGPGQTCQTGMPFQINVIVPMDDERPEVCDYREDSGIVIREMDVPFDVSVYPDTFSLCDASGFDAMIDEMNATYTISDASDYTVVIDRDLGWEDTGHDHDYAQRRFPAVQVLCAKREDYRGGVFVAAGCANGRG